ncbi:MAG: hypothetical protein ACTHJU_00765 [Sphingopyxis sp.]
MKKPAPFLLLLFAFAAPAHAQDENLAQTGTPPERMSVLYTYGDEPCPEAEGDEIVVCAHQPETERYRVPKALRQKEEDTAVGGGSWASAVDGYTNGAAAASRPNSCSPVGSYGYTGCTAAALRDWFAERRVMNTAKGGASNAPN